ncbi:unnamed protein product, partial [Owenia fusiformis]
SQLFNYKQTLELDRSSDRRMTAKVCILVIGILANVVLVTSCGGVDLLRCTLLCCYKKKCQIDDIGDLLDCCCPQGDGGKRSLDEYDMTESIPLCSKARRANRFLFDAELR